MTKWFDVPFDESFVDSTTEVVTLRDINDNDRVRFSVPTLGQLVVPVHKLSDIPLVNGFRQFEHDKVYNFVEEISPSSDTLLVPAGWNGYIVGTHNPLTKYGYSGTGTCLKTLLLDGIISSIVDAGGGAITVTTSVTHGLLDGQFVNITGTTSYNQQKLLVSNASGSVFDVQIAFVGDESGSYDTGYDAINIINMALTNNATGTGLGITAATPSSVFRYNDMKVSGFNNFGDIVGGTIIGYDGDFETAGDPIAFNNIDKATISTTTMTRTDVSPGANVLTLIGSSTRDIVLDRVQFNVAVASQFPIDIFTNITNAERISITNSPDNNIATNYFDPSGRDQTDPQVFTFNNGVRDNSSTGSESRSVGILEVDGSGGGAVAIEDLTPSGGDFTLDSTSEEFSLNTSTGITTFNGLSPRVVIISYSIEAAQTSGASQDLLIDVRINGIQQAKTIRPMSTIGVGDFVSIQSVGGLFIINPGDFFQLFKDNISNTNNTDIQNTALLIR